MALNHYRIPGPLGYPLEHGDGSVSPEGPQRLLGAVAGRGQLASPIQALSAPQVVRLMEGLPSADRRNPIQLQPFKEKTSDGGKSDVLRPQSVKAKGSEGDKPQVPRGPTKPTTPSPFNPALLKAALSAGIRVRLFKKGEPKSTPGTDLKLPGMLPSVASLGAALLPIGSLPPAQLPGPVPSGPLNLPGPFQPNAFAPGSFIEPPPATAPGAGGSLPISLPAVITAGSVVFFFGTTFASDTKIKEVDTTRIGLLIDKFTQVVREEEERLNRATFNNDWSDLATSQPALWARILELANTDPVTAFKLLKIAFGRTLEDAVAERVVIDADLDDAIDRIGGANQPDFRGRGDLQGFTLDVTTEAGLPAHLDRKENPNYGRFLLVFTYERWFTETL